MPENKKNQPPKGNPRPQPVNQPALPGPPIEVTIRLTFAHDGEHDTSDEVTHRIKDICKKLRNWAPLAKIRSPRKGPHRPGELLRGEAQITHGCINGGTHNFTLPL